MSDVSKLKEAIKTSNRIVLFTGAGISCLSPTNIPDFRSANGIYNEKTMNNIPPEEIISHSFFMKNPKEFYKFYFDKMVYKNAVPNQAHYYFAELEKEGKLHTTITQNIDKLEPHTR